MSKFLRRIYSIWALILFILVFLLMYPFFFVFLQKESWRNAAHHCNRIWARIVLFCCGVPIKLKYLKRLNPEQKYIYCANHASYLDIPVMYMIVKEDFSFLGKSSLSKPLLFGYMYKKLHILVNRKSTKSKVEAIATSKKYLNKGRSLAIFPEGTIPKKNLPLMQEFKEGAFRLAIEHQVPIVPVSILNNYKIFPDDGTFLVRWDVCAAIIHSPIETTGMTLDDMKGLSQKVKTTIESVFLA